MQILPSGGKLPTRTRLRMLKEMAATFLTTQYRMRLSTFDCPPVFSSVSIPIIRYLSVVGACRQEEQESGRADRINRSYEELKSVAGIYLSALRRPARPSPSPLC